MKKAAEIFMLAALMLSAALTVRAQEAEPAEVLRRDVEFLSDTLCAGRASMTPGASEAAMYIMRRFKLMGYKPEIQSFAFGRNIVAGDLSARKKLLVAAYYDGLGAKEKMYPGADSNASGVAAMLALAEKLSGTGLPIVFAAVDCHADGSGAAALKESISGVERVVNLDIMGGANPPVYKFWKDFLIVLGGDRWKANLENANTSTALHLYWDYFNSRAFTDLFYRHSGVHKPFLDAGLPCIMFSSGITMDTNLPSDTAEKLDYGILARRVDFIFRFVKESYGRFSSR